MQGASERTGKMIPLATWLHVISVGLGVVLGSCPESLGKLKSTLCSNLSHRNPIYISCSYHSACSHEQAKVRYDCKRHSAMASSDNS